MTKTEAQTLPGPSGRALLAPEERIAGTPPSAVLLIILAVLAGLFGIAGASRATGGVAGIAFACLLAIFARIAQASAHHKAMMLKK
jgi:hypothetical protein